MCGSAHPGRVLFVSGEAREKGENGARTGVCRGKRKKSKKVLTSWRGFSILSKRSREPPKNWKASRPENGSCSTVSEKSS